jgi:crossover junction endodeoxyribonuclease RuvC
MEREIPCFIGIDPGKKGGLCLLAKNGSVRFFDWPKDGNLIPYFRKIQNVISANSVKLTVLERVHAMPKQGVTSMFTFGMNYGIWQGFLISIGVPYISVPPQTWMKGLRNKAEGTDLKRQVGNAAQRLFPHAELTGPKGGFKDGRADALMMAYYAMLQSPEGGMLTMDYTSERFPGLEIPPKKKGRKS